jgi:hypothetical protein
MMDVTVKNNKRAVTHYDVLDADGQFSFVRFRLETGRTHQIRVHMKYIGHPIVGDRLYGIIIKQTGFLTDSCCTPIFWGSTIRQAGLMSNSKARYRSIFIKLWTYRNNIWTKSSSTEQYP